MAAVPLAADGHPPRWVSFAADQWTEGIGAWEISRDGNDRQHAADERMHGGPGSVLMTDFRSARCSVACAQMLVFTSQKRSRNLDPTLDRRSIDCG